MDIVIEASRSNRRRLVRRGVWIVAAFVALALAFWGRARGPSVPTVDRTTIVIDTVVRGDFVREVRGTGVLVPEHLRLIAAPVSARVERIAVERGAEVRRGQVLLHFANPDVELQAVQADQQVMQAEGDQLGQEVVLRSTLLTQEATVESARTQFERAAREAAVAESLDARGAAARLEVANRRAEAREAAARVHAESGRLELLRATIDSQLRVQRARVAALRSIAMRYRDRVASLTLTVPEDGMIQSLDVQLGQWAPEGMVLGVVVRPGALKALIRVAEQQAREIQVGQLARIDTRAGLVAARVVRKDAVAVQGTLGVELAFTGAPPPGMVPDLVVDGVIELERVGAVLQVGQMPPTDQTGRVSVFRLDGDGRFATRVPVTVGRTSLSRTEVVAGLREGDHIILTDLAERGAAERIRLSDP
jgi:HlyD family secretion protein